jgi:hypothetical protein
MMAADTLIADKAFDADAHVREPLAAAGKTPVIPPRANWSSLRDYDRKLYTARPQTHNRPARQTEEKSGLTCAEMGALGPQTLKKDAVDTPPFSRPAECAPASSTGGQRIALDQTPTVFRTPTLPA